MQRDADRGEPSSGGGAIAPSALAAASPFAGLSPVPFDPIFRVNQEFASDPRPQKANLSIGVYKGPQGTTETLPSVVEALGRVASKMEGPQYLPITGIEAYCQGVEELVLGAESPPSKEKRLLTVQTLGGTGALRLAAELMRQAMKLTDIFVSDPTWDNHQNTFTRAGLTVHQYPYLSTISAEGTQRPGIDFDRTRDSLSRLPRGTAVLLHACCHNPTGVDFTPQHWHGLVEVVRERGLLPVIDFAYQGFGSNVHEDAIGPRVLAREGLPFMVAYSCSKNFSLYNRRTGALVVVTSEAKEVGLAKGQLQSFIRGSYSNPPADGAWAVREILWDTGLRSQWMEEVTVMRRHGDEMRNRLIDELSAHGVDWEFGRAQRGMFLYTDLPLDQVQELRRNHGIYLLDSGRLCVPALNDGNLGFVADSIASVVRARA
jgi:aromatic-amino-acid transaminase